VIDSHSDFYFDPLAVGEIDLPLTSWWGKPC
jgi:hypothetical protein